MQEPGLGKKLYCNRNVDIGSLICGSLNGWGPTMSLTTRQQTILARLTDIEVRTRQTGRQGYSLTGVDVTATIHSLIVKNVVEKEAQGRRIVLTRTAATTSDQ